ncbi:MAG TPA: hypothetical protein VH643_38045 [Gemmataceae bacterium]|jgi:hypothetical protein
MKRIFLIGFAVVVTLSSAVAKEGPYAEDMQFIRELRSHGYSDLAREYLKKLAQNAPPELKKELSLEKALTNLEAANEEPDSGKRITLYAEARAEFQQFLKDNPNHPRAGEARFDIARATGLQGKTQTNRALLEPDKKTRIADGLKARATLNDAFNQLKQLTPSPQTELAMALNLLDQADTYLNTDSDAELAARGKPVLAAQKILEKLAQGDPNDKISWKARAWVGQCLYRLDDPKATDKLIEVTGATGSAVQEGKRLARYFILLAWQKRNQAPDGKTPLDVYLRGRCEDWLRDYPSYGRTPEGYGVRFLLAEVLLRDSENAKLSNRERDNMVALARKQLRVIEQTENDFTDRAKNLKIAAMAKQGTFKAKIPTLKTFEDCYIRAQYEQMQIGEDAKKYADDKAKADAARKAHLKDIIEALQLGVQKPDAKNKDVATDYNNARALLAYYLLNEGKYKDAVAVGENFARNDPKPSQAGSAAIYALLAYSELLGEREGKAADAKLLEEDKAYQEDLSNMLKLAQLMEQRWPKERAGDLARHQIAARLLRQDKTEEAIDKLNAITPEYPSYVRTRFLLARTELQQAAQDKDKGDPKGYRARALAVLTELRPPPAGADAEVNREYIQGKLMLAGELARDKKFKEIDDLTTALAPQVASLKLVDDPEKDKDLRGKFEESRLQLSLYSTVLQADADFKAAKYDAVAKRLDPLVDQFNAGKIPQMKDSELAAPMFALALKTAVQLNKLDRAEQVIKALQELQADQGAKGDKGTTAILAQLVTLISQQVEDLRKKGDKDSLQKAKVGFTSILNKVAGGQKTPTPQLAYLLAKCYSGMDEHKKAADLLEKFAAEPVKPDAGPEVQRHHAIQLLLVQEQRQLKEFEKAQKLLDEIIGTKEKPGWGARDLEAQKARVMLLEDKGDYRTAALLCDSFIKQLVKRLDDNKLKDQYFEFYYHLVYCILKHGQRMSDEAQKTKSIKDAAHRIVVLEKAQSGLGNAESRKRFEELLEKEADLREAYKAQKAGK